MASRSLPWNRLAGAIEEEGSALRLLEQVQSGQPERLFEVEKSPVSLDELEDHLQSWEAEGLGTWVTNGLDRDFGRFREPKSQGAVAHRGADGLYGPRLMRLGITDPRS
jgi:hypothetical protein